MSLLEKDHEHLQPRMDHSSLQSFESGQMAVKGDIFTDNVNSLSTTTDPTLILTQFYHLIVDMETVSGEELVEVLHDLPKIISLKLHRVIPFQQFDSSEEDEEQKCFIQVSETNKITEIYLEQMNDFKELDFLLGLCRHIKHLQKINIESFIREILARITGDSNHYLCLLCLRIPTADDQLIEKLQKIIDADTRLVDCTIKRIMDKIFLQWG